MPQYFSKILLLSSLIFLGFRVNAQGLIAPRASQMNVTTQTIGLTEVTVSYSRPSVSDREIWGKLVPYGQIWRAGANENTTVSFLTNVKVGGQALKAGTYGLHVIPNESDDWVVIFSNNASSWGSFSYEQEEDAARINVAVKTTSFREFLTFDFLDVQQSRAEMTLYWGDKAIPVEIEVDVHELTIASFKDQLRSVPGFTWNAWNQAANYCLTNGVELEQAIRWVDISIQIQENFTNYYTKSQLLTKLGQESAAQRALEQGLLKGSTIELHNYGRALISQGKFEEALEIFKRNAKVNPDSLFVSVGLAKTYQALKDNKNAIKYWRKCVELAPDYQKQCYKRILAQLEDGKG